MTVTLESGESLFTRKGYVIVNRILETLELHKGDKLHFHDGDKILKGQSILKREKEELISKYNAYVRISKDKTRLDLITQDQRVVVRNGATLHVKVDDILESGDNIASFDPFSEPIISEVDGTVKFEDITGATLKEEINEEAGISEKKIVDYSSESYQPRVHIQDKKGEDLAVYFLPGSSYLNVSDGEKIKAGRIIAKLLKESIKTGDITGGLPRVGELFEARRPKTSAILAQISGAVHFKGIVKAKRVIIVEDSYGKEFKHLVPMGRHLLVREGDNVEAGDSLCDGATDPHEVLQILGENSLQRFMMNEVQAVYRLQGVGINDKHIGIIIRQMMRKVEITSVGDTSFIFGQHVDKHRFHEENSRVVRSGGQPAIGRPLLLGITRASLNIDSFFSAASFQETTRVLTNAAIAGSIDYLRGLKENVIIGHPIPAGTCMKKYRALKLYDENQEDLDTQMQLIMEAKQREREDAELMREEAVPDTQESPGLSVDYSEDEADDEE